MRRTIRERVASKASKPKPLRHDHFGPLVAAHTSASSSFLRRWPRAVSADAQGGRLDLGNEKLMPTKAIIYWLLSYELHRHPLKSLLSTGYWLLSDDYQLLGYQLA
jgi:hypothetical protein